MGIFVFLLRDEYCIREDITSASLIVEDNLWSEYINYMNRLNFSNRSSESNLLPIPKTNTKSFGNRSFTWAVMWPATSLWKRLIDEMYIYLTTMTDCDNICCFVERLLIDHVNCPGTPTSVQLYVGLLLYIHHVSVIRFVHVQPAYYWHLK